MFTLLVATLCTAFLTTACGGSKKSASRYQGAIDKQEQCCEGLTDGNKRGQCLQSIVRIGGSDVAAATRQLCADEPEANKKQCHDKVVTRVRSSRVTRQTYACVQKHFVCNPQTGTATQPSAQAQLDCISDLDG